MSKKITVSQLVDQFSHRIAYAQRHHTAQPIHLIHLGPVFPLEYKKRMYIRVLTYDFGHILGVNCEYTNNSGCFAPILQTFGVTETLLGFISHIH